MIITSHVEAYDMIASTYPFLEHCCDLHEWQSRIRDSRKRFV